MEFPKTWSRGPFSRDHAIFGYSQSKTFMQHLDWLWVKANAFPPLNDIAIILKKCLFIHCGDAFSHFEESNDRTEMTGTTTSLLSSPIFFPLTQRTILLQLFHLRCWQMYIILMYFCKWARTLKAILARQCLAILARQCLAKMAFKFRAHLHFQWP